MHADQIALQLYTVRDLAARDVPATLRVVADAGYRYVEVAGLPEMPAVQLATLLADAGLRAIAVHQGIEALRSSPEAVADRLAALGTDRLVVPWMPAEDRVAADDVRRFADELTRFGSLLASRGIRLGTTTTPASSRISAGRRSGTPCSGGSAKKSISRSTSTGRPWAVVIPRR